MIHTGSGCDAQEEKKSCRVMDMLVERLYNSSYHRKWNCKNTLAKDELGCYNKPKEETNKYSISLQACLFRLS